MRRIPKADARDRGRCGRCARADRGVRAGPDPDGPADPGLDGLALTRRLKADAATRHIVIVAFTAGAIEGDAMKLRAAGCDGYLGKPIDVASFARHIRSHLASPD
jgi:hypothetical protein